MTKETLQIIVAAFDQQREVSDAWHLLNVERRTIGMRNAAVLRRRKSGRLRIVETADTNGTEGAIGGGVIGAVIGSLVWPPALPVALCSLISGLYAKLRDTGFPDQRLRTLGESLHPGMAAIVVVIDGVARARVERLLHHAGADVIAEGLDVDIAAELDTGYSQSLMALKDAGVALDPIPDDDEP